MTFYNLSGGIAIAILGISLALAIKSLTIFVKKILPFYFRLEVSFTKNFKDFTGNVKLMLSIVVSIPPYILYELA